MTLRARWVGWPLVLRCAQTVDGRVCATDVRMVTNDVKRIPCTGSGKLPAAGFLSTCVGKQRALAMRVWPPAFSTGAGVATLVPNGSSGNGSHGVEKVR